MSTREQVGATPRMSGRERQKSNLTKRGCWGALLRIFNWPFRRYIPGYQELTGLQRKRQQPIFIQWVQKLAEERYGRCLGRKHNS